MPSRQDYAERWGQIFENSGLPRTSGRIWGWLLIVDAPSQSMTDLTEGLTLTKGSISTNARFLQESGLIERVGSPGSREAFYRIRTDAVRTLLHQKVQSARAWLDLIEDGVRLFDDGSSENAERLADVQAAYRFLLDELTGAIGRWDSGSVSQNG